MRITKVLPAPNWLLTVMDPPINSVSSLQIARPRPLLPPQVSPYESTKAPLISQEIVGWGSSLPDLMVPGR